MFPSTRKRENRKFRRTRTATAKKCTKKRGARAKLLFCQLKAMPSTSSLLKVPNVLNRLGICNLLKIVWRVNEIRLLLNPRVLPLHDSQQILGIRLNAWQREISYVREWYQKEHKNWVSLDGQRSKWWVWNQALDEARKSVRQIQTYLQRLSEGISNHPNTFLLSNSENREHLKNFRNVDCVLASHNKVQDTLANLKSTI